MADEQEIPKKKLVDLRVFELKIELEKRSLDKTGNKSSLVKRLRKALEEEGHEDPDEYLFESDEKKTKEDQIDKEDESIVEEEEHDDNDTNNDTNHEDGIQLSVEDEEERMMNENECTDTSSVHEQQVEENIAKDDYEKEKDDSEELGTDKIENKETIDEEKNGIDDEKNNAEDEPIIASPEKEQDEKKSNGVEEEKESSENKEAQSTKEASKAPSKIKQTPKSKSSSDEKKTKKSESSNNEKRIWIVGLVRGSTRAADVKLLCSKYGKVIDAKIITSKSEEEKCYGLATMSSADEAKKVIQHIQKLKYKGAVITAIKPPHENKSLKKVSRSTEPKVVDTKKTLKKSQPKVESIPKEEKPEVVKDIREDDDEIKMEDTEGEELLKDTEEDKDEKEKEEKEEKASSKKSTSRPPLRSVPRRQDFRPRSNYGARGARRRGFANRNYGNYRRQVYDDYSFPRDIGFGRRDDPYDERRLREEERIRSIELRQKMIEKKQREETLRLERERERLRIEKEKLIRKKEEIIRAEKEKQRLERERLEREKEELRRREHLKSAPLKRSYPKEDAWEAPRKKTAISSRYEGSSSYGEGSSSLRYGSSAYESSRDRYASKGESRTGAAASSYGSSRDKRSLHDHRSESRSTRTKLSSSRNEDWKDRRAADSRYGTMGGGSSWSDRWPESGRSGGSKAADWGKWASSGSSALPSSLYGGSLNMVHSSTPSNYSSSYERSTLRRY